MSIAEFSYSPTTTTVKVGTTVKWTNNGKLGHTVTADNGAWQSGTLSQGTSDGYGGTTAGASYSYLFNQPGTFTYHCTIHPPSLYPGFVGTVVVTQ